MATQLPFEDLDTTLNNLPLVLTGGDPAGFIHDVSFGLVQINQHPVDGHVQNITADALFAGAGIAFEDDLNQRLGPPVQLDGTQFNGAPLDDLSGTNIKGIMLTGPVELQAGYGDNAGGVTNSQAAIGGDLLQATLLEGYGDRSPENISFDSPLVGLDALWESATSPAQPSPVGVNTLAEAILPAGPAAANSLDSVGIDGLLGGSILFEPDSQQSLPPITVGNDADFLHGVLAQSLGNQTLDSLSLGGVGELGSVGGTAAAGLLLDQVLDGSLLGSLQDLHL